MRIIIRADASVLIGAGHVMRSTVIAEEAVSRGIETIFIGEFGELDWLTERVAELNFSKVYSKESDFTPNPTTDILILDSYHIPTTNILLDNSKWLSTVCIADQFTPAYRTKIKILTTLKKDLRGDNDVTILSGAEYFLMRKSISKNFSEFKDESILNILVSGGGSDPFGFSQAMADVLDKINFPFKANFLTTEKMPIESTKFFSHKIGPNIEKLASSADLVFTLASTSCFEFIAREVPLGLACAIENQKGVFDEVVKLNLALPIGYRDLSGWKLENDTIISLIESSKLRKQLRARTRGIIDLQGAKRVVDFLVSLEN